jgi:hypothetical protein
VGCVGKWISNPQSNQHKYFILKQAEYGKDVERFDVLQVKYAIVKRPSRLWNLMDLKFIVDCVVVLHNMDIYYERDMDESLWWRTMKKRHSLV